MDESHDSQGQVTGKPHVETNTQLGPQEASKPKETSPTFLTHSSQNPALAVAGGN